MAQFSVLCHILYWHIGLLCNILYHLYTNKPFSSSSSSRGLRGSGRVWEGLGGSRRVREGPGGFRRVWMSERARRVLEGLGGSWRIREGPEGSGRVHEGLEV